MFCPFKNIEQLSVKIFSKTAGIYKIIAVFLGSGLFV
jgi:hypothetical protein